MNLLVPFVAAFACMLADDPKPASTEPITPRVAEPTPPATTPADATLYHTLAGRDAQVVFTTDAPLEKVVGKSNEVVGYAISGPKTEPAKLRGATWILPIKSFATGIPMRDEHLAGPDWLNADSFPNIQFTLTRVDDVKEVKKGEGFATYSGTLVGTMALHGVSREISVPDAKLSFFDASDKTKNIAPGDLLFIKCDYTVKLSDFGIHNPDVPQKVSDTIKLSQILRLTSQPPKGASTPSK